MASILIVDDEASVRTLLIRLLSSQGHTVTAAEDGTDALARVAVSCPDLVLLDVDMPGMDGLETLGRLRERHPHLSVVMVSGIDDEERALRALDAGAIDFVRKPFELARLQALVGRRLALAG